jgi:hypothetical protein
MPQTSNSSPRVAGRLALQPAARGRISAPTSRPAREKQGMGPGVSPVISQPAAAFCIQTPTLATTVAIHSTVKVAYRKGASVDPSAAGFIVPLVEGVSEPAIATHPPAVSRSGPAQVQSRHPKKASDQAKMLEKAVLGHEAVRRRDFPESVGDEGCDQRECRKPFGRRALFSSVTSASSSSATSVEPTTVKYDSIGMRRYLPGQLCKVCWTEMFAAASSSCRFAPAPSVPCRN